MAFNSKLMGCLLYAINTKHAYFKNLLKALIFCLKEGFQQQLIIIICHVERESKRSVFKGTILRLRSG